ncbi:penicillin-binding protein, 1A family [Poseidonocella sedimentorum]|uniref:peptidoglycan glycosyltransferase n=1 Tax=Poseidonocella sedimentorum TaxID=871652 RepID=A0A1I6D857_9RHOB|nr:penicillin-binding protein, 1A family [Poseidonocella sedimentorum]
MADKRRSPASSKAPSKARAKPAKRKAPRKPAAIKRGPVARALRWVIRWTIGLAWSVLWRLGAVTALLVLGAAVYFVTTLPELDALIDGRARGSVTMLDREGEVFAWRGEQFGGMITADQISPHLKHAILATEDRRFYYHPGVDPIGVASAIRINLSEGRGPLSGHGGSTIAQQSAKLLCLGVPFDPARWESESAYEADCRETSLWRKIKEATYALALELKFTKDEVLTIYINRAFLGSGARGFEAASQRYFGKSAADVSPAEAAMLAGLLTAPTRYAPTNNLQRSQDRAAVIVGLMERQGYLDATEAANALARPARLSEAAEKRAGGYFADWVMSSGPEFFTRDTTEDVLIRTTLDQRLQTAAEEALRTVFDEKVREGSKAQAAIVVMSADGAVRAMVGGRQTGVPGLFNRATQARRQTGSAFKPFVYAAAMDFGYSPLDTIVDEPLTINIPGSGPWSPQNYTNRFYGRVTLTRALQESLNIPAVKISELVGRDVVQTVASEFGIQSDLAEGPALALGASESTLLEMTGAYAGILNGGSSVEPYGLTELTLLGDDSPLMDAAGGGIGERVIQEEAARKLTYMMEKVISEGTGTRARLPDRQAAGKTGTSQSARDAWFIGFTADYVAGVWMGYDDNTPLTGVTGSGLPAEIWHETMVRVHEGIPPKPLPMIVPEPSNRTPGTTTTSRSGQSSSQKSPEKPDNIAENILRDVLRGIFGGN